VMAKNLKRAIDVGQGQRDPEAKERPCSIDLEMALVRLPADQRKQLKPLLTNSIQVFTGHIDHLHRALNETRQQMAVMARMLLEHDDKVRNMPRMCPDCDFTEEYLLSECCMDTAHQEAETTCDWLQKRQAEAKALQDLTEHKGSKQDGATEHKDAVGPADGS
jgi:hypothetical protein